MKKNKNTLTIERHYGDILIDGYAVVTHFNDDLKAAKKLLLEALEEIDKYVKG